MQTTKRGRRPKVRVRYSTEGLLVSGETGEEYLVYLMKTTGFRITWKYQGREVVFILDEKKGITKEPGGVRIPDELFDLLRALSEGTMNAVFKGYNWSNKDSEKAPKTKPVDKQLRLI